jgi:ABC-type bacteriocin/lantibiotic exporter with double-glycine peptidase domain
VSRRWFAPEVVQTSAMDCGPASLKCLLEGFGVHVSYGRLREACQTDVDGTSIDTLEEIGKDLGLDCEQVIMPVDHLLLSEANVLPAILVVRLPNGFTHFVVVWRRHGPIVELMDPSRGRRFTTKKGLLEEVYVHTLALPAATFREWVGSDDFLGPFRARLRNLGCEASSRADLDAALADPGWRSLAALDAAVRMTDSVVRGGGLSRGAEAARAITALVRTAREGKGSIPDSYFTARPAPASEDGEEQVLVRGAVLVRARKSNAASAPPASPELALALAEKPVHPGRHLLALLSSDGIFTMPILSMALFGAVIAAALEAVLLRSIFDVGRVLGLVQHRLTAMAALVGFALVLLLLEWPIATSVLRLGRRLEVRLRLAFLSKIPRLGDRYFQSRPISDMAERSHAIHDVRTLPDFGAQVVRCAADLCVTTAAIAWIDAASAPWAALAAVAAVAVPLAAQPIIVERTLKARSHLGALMRFCLDALVGLSPVRTHGAERALRREHETLLVEWARSARAVVQSAVTTEALQNLLAYGLALPLVLGYLARSHEPAAVLLLIYWALNIPAIGQELAVALRQYPEQRNRTLRLLEPLGAPDETGGPSVQTGETNESPARGVSLDFEGLGVVAAGHTILDDVDLRIESGTHVGIVGASGAGKSSLLGVLLGWHRASKGRVLVDGAPLDHARTERLRRETAWVDPAVHLWNRSLLENVTFGHAGSGGSFAPILESADLYEVLQKMPDGLQTALGEGGALVSGGEGQRVRFARGLMRRAARLVLLDEPFRGLDRGRRRELIGRARAWWKDSTMLCVTHDIDETRGFDRVLVVDGGRIVETGPPNELAARPDSLYAKMLAEEEELRVRTWAGATWRHVRLEKGRLGA